MSDDFYRDAWHAQLGVTRVQADRIATLEGALREYADEVYWSGGNQDLWLRLDNNGNLQSGPTLAREALRNYDPHPTSILVTLARTLTEWLDLLDETGEGLDGISADLIEAADRWKAHRHEQRQAGARMQAALTQGDSNNGRVRGDDGGPDAAARPGGDRPTQPGDQSAARPGSHPPPSIAPAPF
jgi:hypothetical protein